MTKEEKAAEYAENWEEINPTLDFNNMTPIDVSKLDYLGGYNQAMEDYKVKEMKGFLEDVLSYNNQGNFDQINFYEIEKLLNSLPND